MIWASFDWVVKSSICFVDGWMNSNKYGEVLKNHLVDIGGSDWTFQEGNAAVHRTKVNITGFKWQKINVLPWPSLSPDLSQSRMCGDYLQGKFIPQECSLAQGNCNMKIMGENNHQFSQFDGRENI